MRTAKIAAVLCAASMMCGCVLQARTDRMTAGWAEPIQMSNKLRGAITVERVNGGSQNNSMDATSVDGPQFKAALQASLAKAGLLAAGPESAVYLMEADILGVVEEFFGLAYDTNMEVRYWVTDKADNILYRETFASTGEATMGDALIANFRRQIATERAAQKNIEALLKDLMRRGQMDFAQNKRE